MPELGISRVVDEAALRAWQAVAVAAQDADFDALPADPYIEVLPMLSGRYGDEDVLLHLGTVGGAAVATSISRLPVHDNSEVASVNLRVRPDCRSRGYGRALLDAVLADLRAAGRRRVLFEIPTRALSADGSVDEPGEILARSLGARRATLEQRRLLDLHNLDGERLRDEWRQAAAASVGYSPVTWVDVTPAELVDDLAVLLTAMSTDPPQGELELEPERWSVERFRALEHSYLERRRTRLFAAVRHDASGELVGFTDIGIPSGSTVAYQWDTIVRADHRGHRLGLVLKIANLHQIRDRFPDVRYVNTWNADENSHMIAVNEALGFRPMEGWSEWQLDL
ncbi:MAG TPA: GNAT family N-acetyltransferase [Mycobacteriales bacterium]|nr:GNAT family N-acetyltransferase [Mycobacteriales bacterium]